MSERRQINILSGHMINLIAAGEVIERASSVVKELVENAIDAYATSINISLVDAGLKEICVSDNGIGMDEHEIKMAILPHATSKISKETDLFSIHTLGFRGEALASIIAVSNVKIKSCTGNSRGIMLGLKAGAITSEAYIGHPQGTEIQVRNLFFNTPARLQNLKSENVELSYISDYVAKIALANPEISFKLTNNDNKVFASYGTKNILEVISNVYDNDVAKAMIPISGSNGLFKVYGYTSNISVSRASKGNITIIVNKRIVRNSSIVNAVIESYKTLLPNNRYPISVIEVLVDYSLVDVNVHPTKYEVRFSEEEMLIDLIKNTVSHGLLKSNLIVTNMKTVQDNEQPIEVNQNNTENIKTNNENTSNYEEDYIMAEEEIFTPKEVTPIIKEEVKVVEEIKNVTPIPRVENKPYQTTIDFSTNEIDDGINLTNKLSTLYYIGQLFGTYILAQNETGFYLIDQHAANERVNYEKILKELQKSEVITYEILFPQKLSFTQSEALLIKEKMEAINKLGIILDEFGSETFVVRSVPVWMSKGNISEYLEEIITNIISERKMEKHQFLDNISKGIACKKSIKGNEYLSALQIEYLLEDLVKCENPYTCPHGRPIIIKYTKSEVEKWFKRIQ